jgi:hypothetical protein
MCIYLPVYFHIHHVYILTLIIIGNGKHKADDKKNSLCLLGTELMAIQLS